MQHTTRKLSFFLNYTCFLCNKLCVTPTKVSMKGRVKPKRNILSSKKEKTTVQWMIRGQIEPCHPPKKCHKKMAYHGGPTDFMSFAPAFQLLNPLLEYLWIKQISSRFPAIFSTNRTIFLSLQLCLDMQQYCR